jgi:hypothetical protein
MMMMMMTIIIIIIIIIIKAQADSATHPATNSIYTGVLSRQQSGSSVLLTAHLHLASRLRMSAAIPLLPLYSCSWPREGSLNLTFTNVAIKRAKCTWRISVAGRGQCELERAAAQDEQLSGELDLKNSS